MYPVHQATQKLNLKSIGLLVFSFVGLIVFGRAIVSQLGLFAFMNLSWTPQTLSAFIYAMPFVAWGTVAVGVACFMYYGVKTHFHIDRFAMKKQLKKTYVLSALVICGLFLSSAITTPLVSASATATTGYYLATPFSTVDWIIGNYSTGTLYAINGSNWANLMTYPSTTWASYASNSTKVQELVLASINSGTVFLKDVAFDYALTIPENVAVIESKNGLIRTFVNAANTQGSPYTISVDTVNPTYYMAQDSADRFINAWSSTNASYTINSAIPYGGEIKFAYGSFYIDSPILINHFQAVTDAGNDKYLKLSGSTFNGGTIFVADADMDKMVWANDSGGLTFEDIAFNTNGHNVNYSLYLFNDPTLICGHTEVKRCLLSTPNLIANVFNNMSGTRFDDCSFGVSKGWAIVAYSSIRVQGGCSFGPLSGGSLGQILLDTGTSESTIIGNHFEGLNSTGSMIYINGTSNSVRVLIANNEFDGSGIATANTCINIFSAGYTIVEGNAMVNFQTGIHCQWFPSAGWQTISGNNMATMTTGIEVASVDFANIFGNTFKSVTTPYSRSNNYCGANIQVTNNMGYNPLGLLANPFKYQKVSNVDLWTLSNSGNNATLQSEVTYTNLDTPKDIYVSGGTVTVIAVNGEATGLTSGMVTVQPSGNFSVTFSSVPTIKVFGQ